MTLVGSYLRNLLGVLAIVLAAMVVVQLVQLDRSTRDMRAMGEASLVAQLDDQLASRADAIAQVLALNVAESFAQRNREGMFDALMPVATRELVIRTLLIDRHGRIVHDGTRDVARFGDPVSELAPDVNVAAIRPQRLMREDSYAAVVPVNWGERQLGLAYVSLSRVNVASALSVLHSRFDQIAAQRRMANLKITVLCALLLLLMGMGLSVVAARRMARPIEQLVVTTRDIAEGQYDVALPGDRDDELGELTSAIEDMSAQLAARDARISAMAFRDALTGLANRVAFTEAAARTLASDGCTAAAVLFMDLDEFKRVNDTLGHEAGDRMLEVLARRLRDTLAAHRFPDLDYEGHAFPPVARWGGDEFSVLLCGVDSEKAAMRVAAQILTALRQPVSVGGMDIVGGASIGIALYPGDSDNLAGLLGVADVAMYHAKDSGTERIAVYSPTMRRSGEDRLVLEADLRFAIEREQMRLDYEPVYDPISESLTGLVTRLRWQHPEHGILGPEAFIPLAESIDLAATLQCWALSRALAEFAQCTHAGDADVELIVTLMSDRIDPARLTEALADALERDSLDSRRLVLQVEEPRLFRNLMQTVPLLEAVRMLGVQTWVDRFGSGHAAINRLRRLPLDGMTLDATLVKEVDESPADQSLAAAIIALAHSLGLRVSANGVVTRRQLEFLRRSGCDGVRGAYVGAAGSMAAVTQRLDPAQKNLA